MPIKICLRLLLLVVILLFPIVSLRADVFSLDSTGIVGEFPSLLSAGGNPAISYYDRTNGNLKYIRATNTSGTVWGTPVNVDTAGNVGMYTSMALVSGNPAIVYTSLISDLRYVRAADATGTSWGTPLTLASTFNITDTSLAVVNGNPAITYIFDSTGGDGPLFYQRGTDATGSAWGLPTTIGYGFAAYAGLANTLLVVNGFPAVSDTYLSNIFSSDTELHYLRATDANGTPPAWGGPITLDTSTTDMMSAMALIGGNPAIAYYKEGSQLRYIRATNTSGSAWGSSVLVSNSSGVSGYLALNTINGNPAITYYDSSFGRLRFVRATDASGTTWGTPVTVDTGVGTYSKLITANGNPAIAYYDQTSGNLKYARACDANGTVWGQCSITLEFAGAASNGNEGTGFGNLLRVITSDTQPTATAVTVTINVTGGTATAADYNLTGTITIPAGTAHNSLVSIASGITVTDDAATEANETIQLTLSAPTGIGVLGAQTTTTHMILNDDGPGVTINPTMLNIAEGGATGNFNISLNTTPTGLVNITVTPNSQCNLGSGAGVAVVLSFTTTAVQTVTATAVDDVLVEGAHTCPITNVITVSAAAEYPTGALVGVTGNITDNDTGAANGDSTTNSAAPQIAVFDPAISKLGFLLPGQLGAKGEQLEWVVTVSNVGGATGNNVVVTDTLRPELKIDRVNAPDGTVNISGQTVSVTFATIQPGQTFQFSIFTTVTEGITVDNTACVQAAGIATECTTAPAVSSLPSTGETPSWATLLRGLVVLLLVGCGLGVLSRQLRLNAKQE